MQKFIFVTGGVISGLGKGIAAASIGHLLSHKYSVTPIKLDGYLNTDPGTMNPKEHGEVFVLEDGAEVDMDFGHYERFMNCKSTKAQSITMGKIYNEIREKERKGDYLGKTVQMIPHVTDLIKEKIKAASNGSDIVIVEIGGTVGDLENELFIEAARQLSLELGERNSLFVHLTYLPIPNHLGEMKTKPTQQSVKLLLERGIRPDIILTRSKNPLENGMKDKISLFCNIQARGVLSAHDLENIYEIPKNYYREGIIPLLNEKLNLDLPYTLKTRWDKLIENLNNINGQNPKINLAICGKYTSLEDSYASIRESLIHCKAHTQCDINLKIIETTSLKDEEIRNCLRDIDGIIVPGGFGNRGTEGKIKVIEYARKNNTPFLGICLGLQLAVIEFARDVCDIKDATSEEFDSDAEHQIIKYLPGQNKEIEMGGTLRLGAYSARIKEGTKINKIYEDTNVSERHRHRYEVNPEYHKILEENGLILSGLSPDGRLAEFIELKNHPYFVATQGHPELKSKLEKPAPLFLDLVRAALSRKNK